MTYSKAKQSITLSTLPHLPCLGVFFYVCQSVRYGKFFRQTLRGVLMRMLHSLGGSNHWFLYLQYLKPVASYACLCGLIVQG